LLIVPSIINLVGGYFEIMKKIQLEELGFTEIDNSMFDNEIDDTQTFKWISDDGLAIIYVTYQGGESFVDISIDHIKPLNINLTKLKQLIYILNEL